MPTITDAIESLEHELDKNPGDTAGPLFARRYAIRNAMRAWGRGRYEVGYLDGQRDARDTRYKADEQARERRAVGKVLVDPDDLRDLLADDADEETRFRLGEALGEAPGDHHHQEEAPDA